MGKFFGMISLAVFALLAFCVNDVQALPLQLKTEFHGRLQSTFVIRDIDGFQHGVLDECRAVQWRNELKFDVDVRPVYKMAHNFKLNKVHLTYRGAYDAIFDLTDRYDDVREKSPDDFELGMDDLEYENDLREAFVEMSYEVCMETFILRLGRQFVQWGEADGFNVVNVVNPQDNSCLMFFEMPDELATPLWMARLDYSRIAFGPFDSVSVELVAVPDIRPHQFATLDEDMEAPYSFGFNYLKERDILYFHDLSKVLPKIGVNDIGSINEMENLLGKVRPIFGNNDNRMKWKDDVPGSGFGNTEYGIKVQGTMGVFQGALYYFRSYQDDGAMDFTNFVADTTLTFRHPKQNMYGLSFNYFISPLNLVLRGEGCMVDKVGVLDLTGVNGNIRGMLYRLGLPPAVSDLIPEGTRGYVMRKVYHSLIGIDKSFWIRWLNPIYMINTSWQVYWKHIDDFSYDAHVRPFDEKNNFRITGYFYTDYMNAKIHPEIFVMYDPEHAWMTMASVKYSRDGRLFYKLSQMSFWGSESATTAFTQPVDLRMTSELSFRVGYNW